MSTNLEKVYNPKNVETKWYSYWQEKGYFHAKTGTDKKTFVIVIPPPNVTGMLTMGHVLNNTIQDILVRHARMKGYETLWLPGTDHAGISTQTVVERHLKKDGKTRFDYDREAFTNLVWEWALKHKSIILTQLKKLGCSLDWERERFTLDERLSCAVRKVFVHLYKKGLIYRGRRIINWCPASCTALSDEEVIHREIKGNLWYLSYPLEDKSDHIIVTTSRTETMLGDTGVAVNPEDERYRKFIGKYVILPIQNRRIPIIADNFVDPEFGTGAVKVTPAHDPNDFEIGQRHNLEQINIMNPDGTMNEAAGKLVSGRDRFEARKIVVEEMDRLGLLEKVEDYIHSVGFSERAGVMIEPYLSEQWFVKMKPLAEPAIQIVKERKINFHPERWYKTYDHWMNNIRDWCISRQLWWGHRIPVFYCDNCQWQDALIEDPDKCPKCGGKVRQDPDVLDTWFSSWLWPFSTMGWPEKTEDLKTFYPTDDLVTGPDIIFFWVSRMIMAGMEFMNDIPFKNVYFTGIIRDVQGRKMSKSLGNSPDPLDLIEHYGADALRYSVMLIAPQGQDILFSEERLDVGRKFMNKVWNASRFILMNLDDDSLIDQKFDPYKLELKSDDKLILSQYTQTIGQVNRSLDRYRFDEVARIIYKFVWRDFCDWYVESIKDRLDKGTKGEKETALLVAIFVLKNVLKLLHPYAPFITEEIYQKLKNKDEPDIIISKWPYAYSRLDFFTDIEVIRLQTAREIITNMRTAKSEANIPPSMKGKLINIRDVTNPETASLLENEEIKSHIKKFLNFEEIDRKYNKKPPLSVSGSTCGISYDQIYFKDDLEAEKAHLEEAEKKRLQKEINRTKSILKSIQAKLSNQNFLTRAPEQIVNKEKKKEKFNKERLEKLSVNLESLIN